MICKAKKIGNLEWPTLGTEWDEECESMTWAVHSMIPRTYSLLGGPPCTAVVNHKVLHPYYPFQIGRFILYFNKIITNQFQSLILNRTVLIKNNVKPHEILMVGNLVPSLVGFWCHVPKLDFYIKTIWSSSEKPKSKFLKSLYNFRFALVYC
jgi:hypothetical protein